MHLTRKVTPGQKYAQILIVKHGPRLTCVHYCCDEPMHTPFKTVKLNIEEAPLQPPARPFQDKQFAALRIELKKIHLRNRVKMAGGNWNPTLTLWENHSGQARMLGFTDRFQQSNVSSNGKPNVSIREM